MAKKKNKTKQCLITPEFPKMPDIITADELVRGELVLVKGKLSVMVDEDPQFVDVLTGEIFDVSNSCPVIPIRLTKIEWEPIPGVPNWAQSKLECHSSTI